MFRSYVRIMVFGLVAVMITAGSLIYSNHLAGSLLKQEESRMNLLAKSYEFAGDLETDPDNCEIQWISQNVINTDSLIPTILVYEGEISSTKNLGLSPDLDPEEQKAEELEYLEKLKRKKSPKPIVIPYFGKEMIIYYDESPILKKLRFYPYLMLLVIIVFISIVFGSFYIAKTNEQNKVWVGMAKETAHQLGTPVSSLMAWVELLELKAEDNPEDRELIDELTKDVYRLKVIAERFSKIGSVPELNGILLKEVLEKSADYIRKRMSRNISLEVINEVAEGEKIRVNEALFEWVVENLLKNALDAIGDKGAIAIHASEKGRNFIIDITDTGKGIPKHQFKDVFKPGFTTKKRGWGLGLSLTKRVVENYHKGKIFVLNSEVGKGTTFRIILPK